MEITCCNLLGNSVAGWCLLLHANRVRCYMSSEPPKAVSLVVIRCSYQVTLFQPVHGSIVDPPWFSFVTGSGTLLAASLLSWQLLPPCLAACFLGHLHSSDFGLLLFYCFPADFYCLVAFKTASMFMIPKFVSLVHPLSWKKRSSGVWATCIVSQDENLRESQEVLKIPRVPPNSRLGPCHLPIRHSFGFKIK